MGSHDTPLPRPDADGDGDPVANRNQAAHGAARPRPTALRFASGPPLLLDRPRLMGVLNVTPDSFSDGARFTSGGTVDPEAVAAAGLAMAAAGADVLDMGGESTRPGADRVAEAEQIRRVVPAVAALRRGLDAASAAAVRISVDTTRAAVAAAALDAGADMINDVSAGSDDPGMLELAGDRGVPIALMHMRGQPADMQRDPTYADVAAEVFAWLSDRAAAAEAAGVASDRIVIDPGIGFGKTLAHNLALLSRLDALVDTGRPVLLGTSRKSFIGRIFPGAAEAADRLPGTLATTALGVAAGVQLFRVHDVGPNAQAAAVAAAIGGAVGGAIAEAGR